MHRVRGYACRAVDRAQRVWRCEAGSASVEYLALLTLCALTLAATLLGLGPGLVGEWSSSRAILYGPAP